MIHRATGNIRAILKATARSRKAVDEGWPFEGLLSIPLKRIR